jgi:chemotaxis protein histidine kinase CheA
MADMLTMTPPAQNMQLPESLNPNQQLKPPSREKLREIVSRHDAEVTSRIGKRTSLEQRWIEDLEQYHGRYDAGTAKALFDTERSQLFINYTRPKTDALAARLKDLLFPTDEKNWGINPTPVPTLSDQAEAAAAAAREKAEQAIAAQQQAQAATEQLPAEPPPGTEPDPAAMQQEEQVAQMQQQADTLQQEADEAKQAAALLNARLEEARKRADLMEAEIDDQLTECNYQAIKRDQIDIACKLGTGVTKGPVTGDKVRRGWKTDDTTGEYKLDVSSGERPAYREVDIWGFFPDMDATRIEDSSGVYERHLMNKRALRQLATLQGFDKDAIRRLLQLAPSTTAPAYLAQLRNIRAATQQVTGDLYHVWEYYGPLESQDMQDLALHMLQSQDNTISGIAGQALQQIEEVDPLVAVNACMWFCQGEVLKFALYPYDSGECIYSVFNLAKDEASIFGYGIPAIIRDPQAGINGAFRAMMDNAGVSSGPQIVIDMQNIEPEDGDYRLRPRKIWRAKNGIQKENPPFQLFHIETRQVELANIIQLCERFIDQMSAVPQIIQGQTGEVGAQSPLNTALGTAIMHNSANVVFRSIVKTFDDDVTVPDIRRAYDWNMQFSDKPEIKGDYQIDARGSSVLLMRELQAQNLMVIATQLGGHPIYGPMLRNRELLKKIFSAHMIPADEVMLTDDEIDAVLAAAAANTAEAAAAAAAAAQQERLMELENDKMEMQVSLANQANASKERIAKMEYDAAMNTLAGRLNMSLQELEGMLAGKEMDHQSKERIFASEVAIEQRNAAEARARGEVPGGSGGYVTGGSKPKKTLAAPKQQGASL